MKAWMLQNYASRAAALNPSAIAVAMQGDRITYGELEAESNRLARMLIDEGCRQGDRVCLFTEKSPAAIVAMHAVLKAGAAYVPIDLASPVARIAKIVDAAEPRFVFTSLNAAPLIDELIARGLLRAPVGFLETGNVATDQRSPRFHPGHWSSVSAEPLACNSSPDQLAHLLFTSGSTGAPKGVAITHGSVVAFVEWAVTYFGYRTGERHSGHPPLHFDLSTFDVYGTFAAGGELHLVPPSLGIDPRRLAAFIRENQLTQWFSVPSVLTYLAKFDVIEQDDFPSLERLLWCGEVLPTPILAHWMRRLPHVEFTNLYGPTEATIASSYFTVSDRPADESASIPIGVACAGEELLVLDSARAPLPPGVIGEIFIAGAGLSPGYWRDRAKTAAAFVADPRPGRAGQRIYRTGDLGRIRNDGLIEFLGRADSQIKSRGYRIELGEIEAALSGIPEVRECAVVAADSGGFEGTAICCGYAPVAGEMLEAAGLRAELARLLPPYMLPTRWQRYDSLPKNINGKIDRRAIRDVFQTKLAARRGKADSMTRA
jgi:amino acid adenylation domain-containing protein